MYLAANVDYFDQWWANLVNNWPMFYSFFQHLAGPGVVTGTTVAVQEGHPVFDLCQGHVQKIGKFEELLTSYRKEPKDYVYVRVRV